MSHAIQPAKPGFVSGAALSTLSFSPAEEDHIPLEDDRLADDAPPPPPESGEVEVDALAPTQRVPRP